MVHGAVMTKTMGIALFALYFGSRLIIADPVIPPEAEFKIREGRAPFESVEDLIDNPSKVEMKVSTWKVDGFHIIRSESDFHAIFPVPVDKVMSALLDYAGTVDIYPRVRSSTLVSATPEPFGLHQVEINMGIKVLGFGGEYTYITNNWVEANSSNGFTQKFNLHRSVDDKLYQMLGSWYLEPVHYEGAEYTYIRQYAILGIQRGSIAMEIAMKTFGAMSLRQQLDQLSTASKKR